MAKSVADSLKVFHGRTSLEKLLSVIGLMIVISLLVWAVKPQNSNITPTTNYWPQLIMAVAALCFGIGLYPRTKERPKLVLVIFTALLSFVIVWGVVALANMLANPITY